MRSSIDSEAMLTLLWSPITTSMAHTFPRPLAHRNLTSGCTVDVIDHYRCKQNQKASHYL